MAFEELTITKHIQQRLAQAPDMQGNRDRPLVTLSYAQTLDGSIALSSGPHLDISNPDSYAFTHYLRATHDAILVGIRTVLADDPSLTVRLVRGSNPQPVLLDSQLRCPLASKLVQNRARPPWIMTSEQADPKRQADLEALGVRVFRLPSDSDGKIKLEPVLKQLRYLGIRHVMVEGGGQVVTSFLKAQIADQAVLTIGPLFGGGVRAVNDLALNHPSQAPRLHNVQFHTFASDVILRGDVVWEQE